MMYEELEADERRERYYEWLDKQPKCRHCGKLWKSSFIIRGREEAGIYDEQNDEYFCNQTCVDEHEEERSVQAQERRFHKYWEGAGGVR